MAPVLESLYSKLEPGSDAAKIVENIYNNYLKPIYEAAQNAPQKKVDPEREKLVADRKAFEDQKQQSFFNDLSTSVNKIWSDRQNSELKSYLKNKSLNKDQMSMINSNIDAKFKKLLASDNLAQQQMVEILKSGDKNKYIKFMNSKLDKYMPQAVQQVWRAFNGVTGTQNKIAKGDAAKAKSNATNDGVTKPIRINSIPKPEQIDRIKTTEYAKTQGKTYNQMIDQGIVFLKNGKMVKFE